jgi:hypothetical protein
VIGRQIATKSNLWKLCRYVCKLEKKSDVWSLVEPTSACIPRSAKGVQNAIDKKNSVL